MKSIEQIVDLALAEDLPHGDVTTDSLGLGDRSGWARVRAKQDLILSGREVFELVYSKVDATVSTQWNFENGAPILSGQIIANLQGPFRSLLKGERVCLNFLGHLSGVATQTQLFVARIAEGSKTRILDTRKTIPGLRELEKRAVVHGGGFNHRMSLSDAVLIKENHIRAAGGLTRAVTLVRSAHPQLPIEVEACTLDEVTEAVQAGVNRILLDNMDLAQTKEALRRIPPSILTEASGNMSLERIGPVSELGVDFISIGALTHSSPVADISMVFEWN